MLVSAEDEEMGLFQELLDLSAEYILMRHENVCCDVDIKEMNTFLNEEGTKVFIEEIEKTIKTFKLFVEKDFF